MDYYKKLSDVLEYVGVKTVSPTCDDLISSNDSGIGRTTSNMTNISQQSQSNMPQQMRKYKSDLDVDKIKRRKLKRSRNKSI